jgi:hypothetical protein
LHPRVAEEINRCVQWANAIVGSALPAVPRLPGIYVALVDNPRFNAWACPYKGRYFSGINLGLLPIVTGVVMRLLADPLTFAALDCGQQVGDFGYFAEHSPAGTAMRSETRRQRGP